MSRLRLLELRFFLAANIQVILSPNGVYRLVWLESDEGALGGSENIVVEKNKYGIRIYRKFIYSCDWGRIIGFRWIDNSRVEINGRLMNAFKDKPIYEEH